MTLWFQCGKCGCVDYTLYWTDLTEKENTHARSSLECCGEPMILRAAEMLP